MNLRIQLRLISALVVAAVTLVGCLDAPASPGQPSPTREPEPTPVTTVHDLGLTVTYEGLLVHVDRSTAELDGRGGLVDVALRVENPSGEAAQLDAPIRLLIDGVLVEPTRESRVPLAPANGLVGALMTYELQGVTSVDDAVIQIGADLDHHALVPLTAAGGEPVLLQPVPIEVSGSATAGNLRVALRSAVLRWDLPDWSQELRADVQALTLVYDVTYTGTFSGGFAFTGDNVALRLPDNVDVQARPDGHSQSIELIGAGGTKKELFSRFEIPAGMIGTYRLVVRSGGIVRGIPFTIGG
jgi:hypothetical protein